MEKAIKINIPGSKLHINGRLRGSVKSPLVIFVHGLAGHMEEHMFFNGARWFEKQGFATFRFNLYDWTKDTRKLHECTIQTHTKDLDAVVKYWRAKGVKKIYVVGHSYGGPTILASKDQHFDRAVLWDPTIKPSFKEYGVKRNKGTSQYVLPGSYSTLIGEKMYQENEVLDSISDLCQFERPTKVIAADRAYHGLIWKDAFAKKLIPAPHSFVMLKGATHCFDEDGMEEKLFAETLKWIKG